MIPVVEVRDPDADTALSSHTLMTLVSGILGALLGLIAGRSGATVDLHRRPGGDDNGIHDRVAAIYVLSGCAVVAGGLVGGDVVVAGGGRCRHDPTLHGPVRGPCSPV